MSTNDIVVAGVFGLLGIGLYGLLITRNLIKIVMVLQLLVKAAVLALMLAGQVSGQTGVGQSLAATVIVADTMVAVVALAIAIQIRRRFNTMDTAEVSTMKG
jgi:NADH:ubiquinone oxidoreductase subunit K